MRKLSQHSYITHWYDGEYQAPDHANKFAAVRVLLQYSRAGARDLFFRKLFMRMDAATAGNRGSIILK